MNNMVIILLGCVLAFGLAGALSGTQSVRAAWIAHIQCPTESACENVLKSLGSFGITRVYVCAWNNGKVYFNSSVMLHAVGAGGIGENIVGWAQKYAKKYGIPEVYAWFEYGMMAAYNNLTSPFAKFAQKNGWIMGKHLGFWYMNPASLATAFLADLMRDLAVLYRPDGIQLDDHFDCPSSFASCKVSVMLNAAKLVWKTVGPTKLSLSPMPLPNAIVRSNVDWPAMLRAGYFAEVVPQYYTTSSAAFRSKVEENEKLLTKEMRDVMLCGVRVNGSGPLTTWEEVRAMLEFAHARGYGVVVWYSRGIFLDYPKEFHGIWG